MSRSYLALLGLCTLAACGADPGSRDTSATSQSTGITTLDADGGGTGTETAESGDSSGDTGMTLDIGDDPDPPCGMGNGELEFSFIWVANSPEGTVSKLDTTTVTELGRYLVREDGAGSPSRTSVNLSGDVAIGNRLSGITKVIAETDNCVDQNGVPGIQTSSGSADVLAWGQDDCVAWHNRLETYNLMRPVAWTAGEIDPDTCGLFNQKVWTTGSVSGVEGTVAAIRLNGDTGATEDIVPIPEMPVGSIGPYGGAVDADDNFWFHQRTAAPFTLVRLDAQTLTYETYEVPTISPYGITVDVNNKIWLSGFSDTGGIARFDPETLQWDIVPGLSGTGLQADSEGRLWVTQHPWTEKTGVHSIDVNTLEYLDFIDMTGIAPQSHGVSIDFEGYVWFMDWTSSAYKVNPDTKEYVRYDGLNAPYTYSDMTGFGLASINPPAG